jgi:hypothetical protein
MRGQIARVVDAIHALAERTVDLELVRVLVQVDFLVRVAPVEVRLHVAGDDHHRDRVERGVGDAGGGVGQPRTEVGEQHPRLARRAGVAVGGVRRNLLVARADVADAAAAERVEQADDGMAGEAEDDLDTQPLEVLGEQVRGEAGFVVVGSGSGITWMAVLIIVPWRGSEDFRVVELAEEVLL